MDEEEEGDEEEEHRNAVVEHAKDVDGMDSLRQHLGFAYAVWSEGCGVQHLVSTRVGGFGK